MKDVDVFPVIVISLILLCLTAICAGGCGVTTGRNDTRNEAVRVGVAEYYINQYNEKDFRWITNR